jgi:hypothetical protein
MYLTVVQYVECMCECLRSLGLFFDGIITNFELIFCFGNVNVCYLDVVNLKGQCWIFALSVRLHCHFSVMEFLVNSLIH